MERHKLSPDDTSLLGLAAVWAELDAPMPPKTRQHRRAAERARIGTLSVPVIAGLGAALLLALAMMLLLVALVR